MKLRKILAEHHASIVSRWTEAVFATYAEKATENLRTNADPFTNPVGDMVREAAGELTDALEGRDIAVEDVKKALDRFIKIRAVQQFTPSQSVGVIYLLKPILREEIFPELERRDFADYLDLEARVDSLALIAFDMYCQNRELVAEIRVREIRAQYAQLKRWAQALNRDAPLGEFSGCGN